MLVEVLFVTSGLKHLRACGSILCVFPFQAVVTSNVKDGVVSITLNP